MMDDQRSDLERTIAELERGALQDEFFYKQKQARLRFIKGWLIAAAIASGIPAGFCANQVLFNIVFQEQYYGTPLYQFTSLGALLFSLAAVVSLGFLVRYLILGRRVDEEFETARFRKEEDLRELRELLKERVSPRAPDPVNKAPVPAPPITQPPAPQPPAPSLVPELPPDLIQACAAGSAVLYAGLGLGAQAGLPTWPAALAEIVRRADENHLWLTSPQTATTLDPDQFSRILRAALDSGDLSGVPDLVVGRLDRTQLQLMLEDLYNSAPVALPPIFEALGKIQFDCVLSASWDTLLERTFIDHPDHGPNTVVSAQAQVDFAERFRQPQFTIIKLFGTVSQPTEFLFTEDEYVRALGENPDLAKFLSSTSTSKTLFFTGTSLDMIGRFFTTLGSAGPTSVRHYALVPWQRDIEVQQERYLSRWGVELLVFVPSQGYPEVREFCETLAERVKPLKPKEPRATRRRTKLSGATLNKVVLTNIGPFEYLPLDFNPGWNVLLGDNGSGKSTILRAIALALCGDDPRVISFGGPLMRATPGLTTGSIELTVGDRTYRTDLVKSSDSVRVRSRQLTPAQEGTWAVVCFPPMRGASARNPAGASDEAEPEYPVLPDILPLLTGAVDYRLDDFKQWVVNTLSRATDAGDVDVDSRNARNRRQIDKFFEIIAELTPGLNVKFVDVTPAFQVLVETDDGIIPIGQLSQGMSSVVGFIGTLLRRMYAFYPDVAQPELEPALVIVDEIDAHLHPSWQRRIAGTMRTKFPGVQIIATTHSPLLLSSLKSNEITRLRRNSTNGKIDASITRYDVEDYTADQILVSPLFDLSATLSPEREQEVKDYTRLVAKRAREEQLSDAEEALLKKVAFDLDIQLASPQTQAAARLAYQIIQDGFNRHAAQLPQTERDAVDDEIRVQLEEMISGSRRPG